MSRILGRGFAWLDTGTHEFARCGAVRRYHRKAAGPQDRLPRRNRLAQRLDRRRGALLRLARAARCVGIWPLPPGSSERAGEGHTLAAARSTADRAARLRGYSRLVLREFQRAQLRGRDGLDVTFVQDNHSLSARGVLRGLHYQLPPSAQGKLVRVLAGILDVAVDVRRSSPTFRQWLVQEVSAGDRRQLYVPVGFAHGFVALEDGTEVLYKTTDYYAKDTERSIRWDDPELAIAWPGGLLPLLADKDAAAPLLRDAETFD